MDDAIIEMLSRYIDGDLGPAEEKDIVERLRSDAVLRSKLEDLQNIRGSLSSLAKNDEVPAALELMVEPLRRGRPAAITARPWVRWLATAAVAILGLTVIVEVNLRGSRQPADETSGSEGRRRFAEPTERFSLAPLPTGAAPPEDRLLGVSERLLARPVPELEFDEAPALQVLGPLETAPATAAGARSEIEEKDAPAASGRAVADIAAATTPPRPRLDSGKTEEALADNAPAESREVAAEREKRALRSAPRQPWEGAVSLGRAQLFVFIGGTTSWQDFEPRARCDTGRYTVRVRIGGGIVREVWAVGGAVSDPRSQHLCAAELARGLAVADVADGDYGAQVVVEPRGAKAQ